MNFYTRKVRSVINVQFPPWKPREYQISKRRQRKTNSYREFYQNIYHQNILHPTRRCQHPVNMKPTPQNNPLADILPKECLTFQLHPISLSLFVSLLLFLFLSVSVFLVSLFLSLSVCLPVYLSFYLSVCPLCLPVCISVSLSLFLSFNFLCTHQE